MELFDYTSGKIKLVVRILFWVGGIIFAVMMLAGFIVGIVTKELVVALLCLFMLPWGVLLYWVSSLMIYGFGRIVENTDEIRYQLENQNAHQNDTHY